MNAIEKLLDVLDEHVGQPWADDLIQGEFGTKGAKAVKELNESIAANKALNKAQMARAQAYGPAYEKYLRFKRVVRDALGPSSKQYRRIHLRASSGDVEGDSAPPASAGAPAPASPPAVVRATPAATEGNSAAPTGAAAPAPASAQATDAGGRTS